MTAMVDRLNYYRQNQRAAYTKMPAEIVLMVIMSTDGGINQMNIGWTELKLQQYSIASILLH